MKRFLKILLAVVAGFALLIGTVCVIVMIRMSRQTDRFDKTPVDISLVADGVYEGLSETDLVKVDVRVTVSDGKISNIEILRHECGKGRPAENMIPAMLDQNTVEVDAVSGATFSSAVIKDAVRNALRNGIK